MSKAHRQEEFRRRRRARRARSSQSTLRLKRPRLDPRLEAAFDWRTFVCTACGEEIFVGRDPEQSVEDFALMCDWLYGYPPRCSACARGEE